MELIFGEYLVPSFIDEEREIVYAGYFCDTVNPE